MKVEVSDKKLKEVLDMLSVALCNTIYIGFDCCEHCIIKSKCPVELDYNCAEIIYDKLTKNKLRRYAK